MNVRTFAFHVNVCDSLACRAWLLVLTLLLIAHAAQAQEETEFKPNVVVVQFEPGIAISEGAAKTGAAAFDAAASAYGVTSVERPFAFLDHVEPTPKTERNLAALRRTYHVRYSADENPLRVAKALAAAAGVAYAEPVLIHRYQGPLAVPNDTLFSDQAYLRQLRLPEAWTQSGGRRHSAGGDCRCGRRGRLAPCGSSRERMDQRG